MTEVKKTEKKNNILNTAISLFQKNTVAATAVDDIVKSAGIARGTFYLYFKDKTDLLEQIIMLKSREAMVEILKESFEPGSFNDDLYEMSHTVLNNYIDFLIANKDVLCILEKNISAIMKKAPDFGDEQVNLFHRMIVDRLTGFGYDEATAIKTIYIIADMTGSVCSDAILTKRPYPIEDIREDVIRSAIAILESGRQECLEKKRKENAEI